MAILEAKVVNITPTYAAQLLSTNHQNRVLNKDRVNKYASDMRSGAWKESGQGVTIYRDTETNNEYLQDGQTRLYGIIESGIAQRFVIVWVNEPVFDVIDIGQTRSLAQMIGIHFRGKGNSAWLTITATALSIKDVLVPYGEHAYRQDSKARRIQRLEENIEAVDYAVPIIKEGYLHCGKITGPAGHIAALVALCDAMNANDVLPFFLRVAGGENLRNFQPEYTLRESLLSRQFSNRTDITKISMSNSVHLQWYEAAIRSWNAYAKNEPMQNLRIQGTIPPILTVSGREIEPPRQSYIAEKIARDTRGAATRLAEKRAQRQ